jgi:hypothetical protein
MGAVPLMIQVSYDHTQRMNFWKNDLRNTSRLRTMGEKQKRKSSRLSAMYRGELENKEHTDDAPS